MYNLTELHSKLGSVFTIISREDVNREGSSRIKIGEYPLFRDPVKGFLNSSGYEISEQTLEYIASAYSRCGADTCFICDRGKPFISLAFFSMNSNSPQ